MELRYCIFHEEMVETECEPICGHIEPYVAYYGEGEVGMEIDFCEFPLGYAFVPMPETMDIELISAFDRPYTVDLLENQEQAEEEFVNVMVELEVMEV